MLINPPFAAQGSNPLPEVWMRDKGFCVLEAAQLCALTGVSPNTLRQWSAYWQDLPVDDYLKDGGRYRYRRHSSFMQPTTGAAELQLVPHRAHYQPTTYNALHGGMLRWFEPLAESLVRQPEWRALITGIGRFLAAIQPVAEWFIEAHAFRIDTSLGGSLGRPTPEGAHRDGVDFVAVILVNRQHITGGETRVFDAGGPAGVRFTLTQPWSVLLLNDHQVIHESTPIQATAPYAHRDTLVLTYRQHGFLSPQDG